MKMSHTFQRLPLILALVASCRAAVVEGSNARSTPNLRTNGDGVLIVDSEFQADAGSERSESSDSSDFLLRSVSSDSQGKASTNAVVESDGQILTIHSSTTIPSQLAADHSLIETGGRVADDDDDDDTQHSLISSDADEDKVRGINSTEYLFMAMRIR
jgi:hypothetical protein